MPYRDEKLTEAIRTSAAEFINLEAGRKSLITVTNVRLSKANKEANILVTVFPDSSEKEAIDFLKRQRGNFREFFKEKLRTGLIPFFDFDIDVGEKNRQRIEEISKENRENSEQAS